MKFGLERASGLFNLRQSTMAAAFAEQTALCGRFGLTKSASLASVGAGAPSAQTLGGFVFAAQQRPD